MASNDTSFVNLVTVIAQGWIQAINDYVFKGRDPNYVTSVYTAGDQTYTITLPSGSLYSAASAGDSFSFVADFTAIGASFFTVVGSATVGPVQIRYKGAALVAGAIVSGSIVHVTYVGGFWQLRTNYDLAPLSTPTFVGTPAAPTAAVDTATTQLATTAFVVNQAYAKLASPALTGNPTAPTQSVGNNSTRLATTAFVLANVSGAMTLSSRAADTILGAADKGTLIDITSGTFSQTFTAAATLGSGWYCFYRNSGTGDVTLDPATTEQIDGLTSFVMYGQEVRLIQCDGTKFTSVVLHPFYRKATSTFTFVMPPGYLEVKVDLVGGGGGGGAGRRGAAGSLRGGGAPGGAPGRAIRHFRNITVGSSTTVTIGAAGVAAAAQTVNSSDGASGTAGGNSAFGTLLLAFGGVAGAGGIGTSNPPTACSTGSGSISAGISAFSGGQLGGQPGTNLTTAPDALATEQGGGVNSANTAGGCSIMGGAGSSFPSSSISYADSGSSVQGVSAASHGALITSTNTMAAKAPDAGLNGTYTAGGGAVGGTCGGSPTVGGNGAAATTDDVMGNPGAGGGSSITTTGKAGGNGGAPGGPGGGGGASVNGNNSGAGGAGAAGQAVIVGIV